MTNIDFVKICIENKNLRMTSFRKSLIAMRYEKISKSDVEFFKNIYFDIKGDAERTAYRSLLLQALVLQCLQYDLKDFFLMVFKKERYLDTRLTAIRGYSAYATETEVIPLMDKFLSILIKRPETTPYNYQEYETLRSKFGLPYLIEHYGYDCFKKAMEQLEKQYNDMPDEVKGIFTLDENGAVIELISPEEVSRRFDVLFCRN